MYDTNVTVVGTVLTKVDRRQVSTGAEVVNFRVASRARRYDKGTGQWTDGDSLFVRVRCWRLLAENVARSVYRGDPVVVTGRLYTREYEVDGVRRWSYELEASSVGHDLNRGTAEFTRRRPADPAGVVETNPAVDDPAELDGDAMAVEDPLADAAMAEMAGARDAVDASARRAAMDVALGAVRHRRAAAPHDGTGPPGTAGAGAAGVTLAA